MKVRIWYRPSGTVAITFHMVKSRMTYEEAMLKKISDNPEFASYDYDDVDESMIPQDRKYREAWTGSKGQGIEVDLVKKAEIDARPIYTGEQRRRIHRETRRIAVDNLIAKEELQKGGSDLS